MTLSPEQTVSAWQDYNAKAWQKGRLRYLLHSAQQVIYDHLRRPNIPRDIVVLASRRFGKSFLGTLMAIEDCIQNPYRQIRIIGPDIKQTSDIVVGNINKIIKDAPDGLIRRTKSDNKWIIGSSELVIGGFDSSNIEGHRGKESYAIYLEETGSSNPDQYSYGMRDVLKPHLLHTRGHMYHLTTLPTVPGHPFEVETIPEAVLNDSFFKFTIYDNPLLDEDQIAQAIKDSGGINSVTFKREYLCESVRDENILIVPEFNESIHVRETSRPGYAKWQVVLDAGGIKDKTVAFLTYYDFELGKGIVDDERVFEPNTSTEMIVAALRNMEHGVLEHQLVRYGDVTGQGMVDMRQTHGYQILPVHKEDWEANINALKVAVGGDRWLINPRCRFLIASLNSGTFNKTRTDFERTSVLGHCDAIAAFMYANRMLDKSSPYSKNHVPKSTLMIVSKPQSEYKPTKRFGSFK